MYKILIRPLAIGDANISWKWRNDIEVWAQTGNRPDKLITLDIENEWIEKALKDDTTNRFAITVDEQYVGNVQLTNITDSEAQFHIFIGEKSFWGKGVANQATYQILNYAKEILKLTKVYLYVKKSNVSAIKVYRKNSFIEEGQDNENIKMTCKLIDLAVPMLSVFCMVYNHEKYISDAIEGFLMQKTNFNTVIVIGEDCSTDGSRNVINSYVKRFPGKFRLLYHDINIGASKNQEIVLKNCNGKYVAMCEGDDYWTDPLKLQKQVGFLESNPEYIFCFHNSFIKYENSKKRFHLFNHIKKSKNIELKQLIDKWIVPTASIVFNKKVLPLPNWSNEIYSGDMILALMAFSKGKVYYIKDNMSVYRKQNTDNSASHLANQDRLFVNQQHLKLYVLFNKETNFCYNTILTEKIKFLKKIESFAILSNKSIFIAFLRMPFFSIKKIFRLVKNKI